jgi:hypothetical protein
VRAWLDAETDTARTRLGLVRGFGWLATTPGNRDEELQRQGLRHASAAVRAAAALAVRDVEAEPVVGALVHGALGSDGLLALACRHRLRHAGATLFEPATDALRTNAEPDVYGNLHPAGTDARRWLLLQALQQAPMCAERFRRIAACVSPDELAACLHRWDTPRIETLRHGLRHDDARVRAASAAALDRIGANEKAGCLTGLLGDADPAVRREAYSALRRCLAARQGKVSLRDLPPAAWWRGPLRCIRLLWPPRRRAK